MFTPLTITGLVVGIVLILSGGVFIVLSYTTLFYTTKSFTAAGDSFSDGRSLIALADVAWDDTGIVLDSTGKFVKWTSTKLYSDAAGGTAYSYDLVKAMPTGTITTKTSNSGLKGLSLNGSTYLTNNCTTSKTWASFPKYHNNMTVIYAFSCPSTKGATYPSGMSFWHFDSRWATAGGHLYDTCIDTLTTSFSDIGVLGNGTKTDPFDSIKTYTSTEGVIANNISAFTYSSTTQLYSAYLNGNTVKFDNSETVAGWRSTLPQEGSPSVSMGHTLNPTNTNEVGTVCAAYVFSRVLSATEVSSVSFYLQQKYFSPFLQYPSTINVTLRNPLSAPIRNTLVPNAAPIVSYSISPGLPAGLTLHTTTGEIFGAPTKQSISTAYYTITATNAITSSTANVCIRMEQNTQSKNGAPNITLSSNAVSVNIGGSVSSPMPVNTGGTILSFSIQPVLSDPGLKFDPATGVISGTPTINSTTVFTITANNDGGMASSTFRLQVGNSLSYPDSIHGRVGTLIPQMIPTLLSVDGASIDITNYSCTGDLHGLTFDKTTGIISGTPTTSGVNDLSVTAKVGTETLKTQIHISIVDSKEFKNKYVYIGAGGAAITAGAALGCTACFYGFDWNSS